MNRMAKIKSHLATATLFLTAVIVSSSSPIQAECIGKVEISPAYIHLDVLHSNQTIKEHDMPAIKADISVIFGSGWCVKPAGLYGKDSDGELYAYGIGFGHCIPIRKNVIITPLVGATYTNLSTEIHLDYGKLGRVKYTERFESIAPYIGLDIIYSIRTDLRLCLNTQYAWSHSNTKVKDIFNSKSDSSGPTIGALCEYDLCSEWSINVGVGYNESMSEEKHGIRAYGAKLGLARWF